MEREIFICKCENLEHQVTFSYIEDDNEGDVYMEVHLSSKGFWQRLVNGFKYIFGYRSKYGDFDEMIIKKEDVRKLEKIVEYLKK